MERTRGDDVDPAGDRQLEVPAEALPAEHSEASDHPNRPADAAARGPHRTERPSRRGPARAGRPVEQHPLVAAIGAAQDPACDPIGITPNSRERLLTDGRAGYLRAASPAPTWPDPTWARGTRHYCDPPFVDCWTERMIDLLHHHLAEALAARRAQPALLRAPHQGAAVARHLWMPSHASRRPVASPQRSWWVYLVVAR